MSFDVVIPTSGRPSLTALLHGLLAGGPLPGRVIVVDDRRRPTTALVLPADVECIRGPGRGPAAARNAGWRAASAPWVAFLDDDVLPPRDWPQALARDLEGCGPQTAGSQGVVVVPRPEGRRPTDWERNVQGLESARWATADMAFRRAALELVGGFDERFPRAYREDADLALRLLDAGLALARGQRQVLHPVRAAGPLISLRLQAGNADDALMDALHSSGWRARVGAPRGRFREHLMGMLALCTAVLARRRIVRRLAVAAWLAGYGRLTATRIAPGPRTPSEVSRMALTSLLLPPLAVVHRVRGFIRARTLLAGWHGDAGYAPVPTLTAPPPLAVLFDRDDTLIEDVPYNGDPELVRPMPGAREALDRLRAVGCRLAVVSNQSGIGRGLLTADQVAAVNHRVEELLGPFEAWLVCPHAPEEGCECRKPAPGLILRAAERLGVSPLRCAVVGDIGADVQAAQAAGARPVLVPARRTRSAEVRGAPEVARDLAEAVQSLLGARVGDQARRRRIAT